MGLATGYDLVAVKTIHKLDKLLLEAIKASQHVKQVSTLSAPSILPSSATMILSLTLAAHGLCLMDSFLHQGIGSIEAIASDHCLRGTLLAAPLVRQWSLLLCGRVGRPWKRIYLDDSCWHRCRRTACFCPAAHPVRWSPSESIRLLVAVAAGSYTYRIRDRILRRYV